MASGLKRLVLVFLSVVIAASLWLPCLHLFLWRTPRFILTTRPLPHALEPSPIDICDSGRTTRPGKRSSGACAGVTPSGISWGGRFWSSLLPVCRCAIQRNVQLFSNPWMRSFRTSPTSITFPQPRQLHLPIPKGVKSVVDDVFLTLAVVGSARKGGMGGKLRRGRRSWFPPVGAKPPEILSVRSTLRFLVPSVFTFRLLPSFWSRGWISGYSVWPRLLGSFRMSARG